ncbi:MAG TPA: hypothetical protein VEQ58_23860 [Polyangiaceae bacterium]|nr:hypothetical protein [Polyangiaceae bacterium]
MESQVKGLGDEALMDAAFERVKPELLALKADELSQVTLDIPPAVATVLGVLPEVRALRDQVAELPRFDMAQLDKLEDYAWALSYAHGNFQAATTPPDDLEALNEDAIRMRDTLLAEARSLIQRGIVSAAQLSELSGTKGYKNLSADLVLLRSVMQAAWPQIEGKTLTTTQDLELALRLAARLLRVVGLREQGPARVAEATEMRQRAFTKLMKSYRAVRRAVAYIRDEEEDADKITPALHQGRPRRRPDDKADPSQPDTTTPPVGTAPNGTVANGTGANGSGPNAAEPTTTADDQTSDDASTKSPSGPFMR